MGLLSLKRRDKVEANKEVKMEVNKEVNMERKIKLKIYLITIGIAVLFCILLVNILMNKNPQVEGSYISNQQIAIQLSYLLSEEEYRNSVEAILLENKENSNLTYQVLEKLLQSLSIQKDVWEKIIGNTYQKEHMIIEKEWYQIFDQLISVMNQKNNIHKLSRTILGSSKTVTNFDKTPIAENQVLTDQGIYEISDLQIKDHLYQNLTIYVKDNTIFAYLDERDKEITLENCLVLQLQNQQLYCLIKKYIVKFPYLTDFGNEVEEIADLKISSGQVTSLQFKKDKYTGKLLNIKDNTVEIENIGIFPIDENAMVYKLFGKMEEYTYNDLAIGYSFTDFVIEDGEIVAFLVMREEAMETIRVLIQTSNYQGNYHEELKLIVDTDFTMISGEYETQYKAGETLTIDHKSKLFHTDRIIISPIALTGKIQLLSVDRHIGNPTYRGTIEIKKTPDGLLVTNELLLEEYLYAVVPSEMPASYPDEALKAQAVSARTYAYRYLLQAGLPEFGAHVDDSTNFQVYHNIGENLTTSQAVKDSQGEILFYGDELAATYYYSTSCGMGTNIEVWTGSAASDYPYLSSKKIGNNKIEKEMADKKLNENSSDIQEVTAELGDYKNEDIFKEFITQKDNEDFEVEEGWYRWTTKVETIDEDELLRKLQERYQSVPNSILTETKNGDFTAQEIKALGAIEDIRVTKRNEGGISEKVIIQGEKATIQIEKEYNIRYILSNGSGSIMKQNGESVNLTTLLPSGYFVLETIVDKDKVIGYDISGGGYGHGVGMSQNGAKAMAIKGYSYSEIIGFFYEGTVLEKLY